MGATRNAVRNRARLPRLPGRAVDTAMQVRDKVDDLRAALEPFERACRSASDAGDRGPKGRLFFAAQLVAPGLRTRAVHVLAQRGLDAHRDDAVAVVVVQE